MIRLTTLLALTAIMAQGDSPITTPQVSLKTGELSVNSAIVVAHCNEESNVEVTYWKKEDAHMDGSVTTEVGHAFAASNSTLSFLLEDLAPYTMYGYSVKCTPIDTSVPSVESKMGYFETSAASLKTPVAAIAFGIVLLFNWIV